MQPPGEPHHGTVSPTGGVLGQVQRFCDGHVQSARLDFVGGLPVVRGFDEFDLEGEGGEYGVALGDDEGEVVGVGEPL